jgi:hypothetical protein
MDACKRPNLFFLERKKKIEREKKRGKKKKSLNSPETRKNGILEHLSTKNVAGPNAGVKRLRQKNTAWATP